MPSARSVTAVVFLGPTKVLINHLDKVEVAHVLQQLVLEYVVQHGVGVGRDHRARGHVVVPGIQQVLELGGKRVIGRDAIACRIEIRARVVAQVWLEDKRIIAAVAVEHPIGEVVPRAGVVGSGTLPAFEAGFCIGHGSLQELRRLRTRGAERIRAVSRVPMPVVRGVENVLHLV